MAHLQVNFKSEILRMQSSMQVILPDTRTSGAFPVLYLLHGISCDDTSWRRQSSIERYVSGRNIAVVMPNVHRSFYTDMDQGGKYWTFVAEELPSVVASYFNVSQKRRDTYAAGFSMGGYGALKLGLRCPERFQAVAGMSSAVMEGTSKASAENTPDIYTDDEFSAEIRRTFGEKTKPEDDIYCLAEKAAVAMVKPRIFLCCGKEDFLYDNNVRFNAHLNSLGYNPEYREHEGHAHTWTYWDMMIQEVLEWMFD